MADPNPFDQFDTPANGPVYGPPPTPKTPSLPSGYEPDPASPGAIRPIKGGPSDTTPKVNASDVSGDAYLKTLDNGTANMVKALADGRKSFPSGSALRAPYWQEMLTHVSNYDPGFDEVNYTGRSATRRDFTSGKAANNIRALNTAIGHLGHLEEQIGGTASHSFTPLNAVENAGLRVMGDPGPTNFDTTVSALAGELTAVYRGAGGAEADIQRYIDQLNPNASKAQKDGAIRNIVGLLKSRLDALNDQYRQGMGTTAQQLQLLDPQAQLIVHHLGGFDEAGAPQGDMTRSANLAATYEGDNGQSGPVDPAGTYKTVDDPKLTGLKGEYLSRLSAGQSPSEIIRWAQSAGVPMSAPLAKSISEQVAFRRKNPDVKLSNYDISAFDDRMVPTSGVEQGLTDAAGTAPGAFAINAGNAAGAGIPLAATGNQYLAPVTQAQHPTASALGDVAGSAAAMVGGEAALGQAGMGAGLGREMIANMGYGAARGAAESPDNRLSGAGLGALAAGGGTLAGRALTGTAASLVSPSGGKLSDLYAAGVRPTPGQRFADSGLLGRTLNAVEEQLGSVPIVGSAIRGARQEARNQFQIGAFNQALGEIGQKLPRGMKPGTEAHAFTQKAFDEVYDRARGGMRVAPDQELASDVSALQGQVSMLAEPSIRRFQTIVQNVVMRRAGATIDGPAYKKIQSELGKVVRGIRKNPSGDGELADALDGLSEALDSAARRHSAPEAVALMDAADKGYAKFVQIENASAKGGAGKEAGTFSPNDFASAVKGNGQRVRSKAYNQGQGLMQDYAEQGKNLTDRVPNSGSPERQLLAATVAGGTSYVAHPALGVLGVIGALYAPGLRKLTTGVMKPRGPAARAIADSIRKRGRIAGTAGAALAVQPNE
jgi:hypothetical protein